MLNEGHLATGGLGAGVRVIGVLRSTALRRLPDEAELSNITDEDPYDGLRCSGTLEGTGEQAIALSTTALNGTEPWMVRPQHCPSPHLRDLDDRLTTFLARTTRRQRNDSSLQRANTQGGSGGDW